MPKPTNPYGTDWRALKVVQGRVSPLDFSYIEGLFPFVTGLQDIIISTLYKKFIHELRTIDAQHITIHSVPLESAFGVTHPTNDILSRLLEDCNFGRRVEPTADATRDGRPDAGGVHPTLQPTPHVQPNPKSRTGSGKRNPRGKAKTKKGDKLGGQGNGVAGNADGLDKALASLKSIL